MIVFRCSEIVLSFWMRSILFRKEVRSSALKVSVLFFEIPAEREFETKSKGNND